MSHQDAAENPPISDVNHPSFNQQFFSEFRRRILNPITLFICVTTSILTSLIGPYGTYESDPFIFRAIFWTSVVFSSTFIATFIGTWSLMRFEDRPYWLRALIATLFFSAVYTPLLQIVLLTIYESPSLPAWELFAIISTVCALVYTLMWFVENSEAVKDAKTLRATTIAATASKSNALPSQQTVSPTRPDFHARLGPDAGKRLIRLAMADHYIEAHTETGMHLLYMRFTDAIAELEHYEGCQVHRSHWVNFTEVDDVVKDGPKLSFVMSDGSLAPISRSRRKDLKARQLI